MNRLYDVFLNAKSGDHIVIAPGEYHIYNEIPLHSGITVNAEGAVFYFPQTVTHIHMRMFVGESIHGFSWSGGTFIGHVFDPAQKDNLWEPNTQSIAICIDGGSDLHFCGITGKNLAGPIICVNGTENTPVKNIVLDRIYADNCGRFMWDYGYLWQRITFPEYHTETEVENAYRYMPSDSYSDKLHFEDEKVSSTQLPPYQEYDNAVTFFGNTLPLELKKGRYYYAQEQDNVLLIRERLSEPPIRFTPGKYDCKLFRGIYKAYHAMYAPLNSGTSKGAVDINFAESVFMTGSVISAMGDATHFYQCRNGKISENVIKGARMGAMFLSFGCENMLVESNIVDGNNGSRILTVETGGTGIKIIGNIFKNGGRGTWIDTPQGILLKDNIFLHNTCKSTPDPAIGRISPTEGTFEHFAEIYFTTRKHGAVYGDIRLENNLICTGDGCNAALAFNAHGNNISVMGNVFEGTNKNIYLSAECENICIQNNYGDPVLTNTISNESFDIPGTIYLPDGMRKLD